MRREHTRLSKMADRALKATEFVALCEELALRQLPADFAPPRRKVMWTILQLYCGPDQAAHFEVQPQMQRRTVELGLHFEGPVEWNDAWAALLAGRADELGAALGPGWELEEWTASWRRLHRTFHFETLTRPLADEVAGELAKLVSLLGPLVAESPVGRAPAPPARPATPVRRHHGRHAARA
jgi:hypothetical protein